MRRTVLILALLVAACSSDIPPTGSPVSSKDPVTTGPLADALIVSDPEAPQGSSVSSYRAASVGSGTIAYVSLPSGNLPDSTEVRIVNLRTGEEGTPVVIAGGFDPIGIPAVVGDTLDVAATTGRAVTHTLAVTLPARPPRVVRTNPPKGKTDVTLNTTIVVVISEPADPGIVLDHPIILRVGTSTVGGTIGLDSTGTVLTFIPLSPLEPGTVYEIAVTGVLTDRSGTPLEPETSVSFTTAERFLAMTFLSVGAGHGFSCGLVSGGDVYCWGYNWSDWIVGICPDVSYWDWFPCGLPRNAPPADRLYLTPVRLAGGLKFKSLSVGWRHACGITTSGAAYCWGYAAYAQLGSGSFAALGYLAPQAVAGGIAFKSISAGDSHTCGVALNGTAFCWGLNVYGELGNGSPPWSFCSSDNADCSVPQKVLGDLSFVSVSTGSALTCGLTTSSAAYCWGSNVEGDLGIGTPAGPEQCELAWLKDCSRRPVPVAGGHTFTAISAVAWAACGLDGHTPFCWGFDYMGVGQTADGCDPYPAGECSTIPRPVAGSWQFTGLSAAYGRACATTADGAAYCWGSTCPTCIAGPPHPPDDAVWDFVATPTPVPGGLTFAMVSTGPTSHSCGVTAAGEAYCWGDNSAGQLGDGTRKSSAVPVRVGLGQP